MKRERIAPPYKVHALRADGVRVPLDAHGLVVELAPGIEVEIDFAPHPGFRGHLVMFTPPPRRMKRIFDQGKVDDFAVIFGASNVLHVFVERRIAKRRIKAKRGTGRPGRKSH